MSACLCLAAAITLSRLFPADLRKKPDVSSTRTGKLLEDDFPPVADTETLPAETPDVTAVNSYGNTSDTYADLPELLAYLSAHDTHSDRKADGIFVCNNSLLVISRYHSDGDELNPEMSVRVSIYDITVPPEPVLLDEYIQLGDLTAY